MFVLKPVDFSFNFIRLPFLLFLDIPDENALNPVKTSKGKSVAINVKDTKLFIFIKELNNLLFHLFTDIVVVRHYVLKRREVNDRLQEVNHAQVAHPATANVYLLQLAHQLILADPVDQQHYTLIPEQVLRKVEISDFPTWNHLC